MNSVNWLAVATAILQGAAGIWYITDKSYKFGIIWIAGGVYCAIMVIVEKWKF